jgi:hypothetical protein
MALDHDLTEGTLQIFLCTRCRLVHIAFVADDGRCTATAVDREFAIKLGNGFLELAEELGRSLN